MIRLKALQAHFSTERVSLRLGHVFEKFQPPREFHDVCVCVVYVDMCVGVCRNFQPPRDFYCPCVCVFVCVVWGGGCMWICAFVCVFCFSPSMSSLARCSAGFCNANSHLSHERLWKKKITLINKILQCQFTLEP